MLFKNCIMQNPQTDRQLPICAHRNVSVKEVSFSGNKILPSATTRGTHRLCLFQYLNSFYIYIVSETHFPLVHFPVCPCQAQVTPVWTEKSPGRTEAVQLNGTRTGVFSFGSLWAAAQPVLREIQLISTAWHQSQADEVECGDSHYLSLDPVLVQCFSCELIFHIFASPFL